MIEITVVGCLGGYEARAEADDPESAMVAARTLWADAQDAIQVADRRYHNRCVTTFAVDGTTVMRTEEAIR